MTDTVVTHNAEENNYSDARGRQNYVSLAKNQQLQAARESKKRKAEEAEERQRILTEKMTAMEGLLVKMTQAPPPPPTNNVKEHSEEDEEEPEFPGPPRKRRRLLNSHRRVEPADDYAEPAGWGIWTKVGTLAGLIAFNSVTAALLSKYRTRNQTTNSNGDAAPTNIGFE